MRHLLCDVNFVIEHDLVLYHLYTMSFDWISVHLVKNKLFFDCMWKAMHSRTTSC